MFAIKHKKVCDDPEMFATYLALAQEACEVVKAHKDRLVDQIAHILSDGVKQGAFQVTDVKASARAIFDATIRFHHPAHSEEWSDPELSARIDALLALLLRGLEAPRVSAEVISTHYLPRGTPWACSEVLEPAA